MGEYIKSKTIYFQIDNIPSIKEALQQYQTLLNNRTAISNKGFHMEYDVKFMENSDDDPRNLKLSDIKNFDLFKKAICLRSNFYSDLEHDSELKDKYEVYLSEPLFFSIALEHDELKEEIVKTAKGIAEISRYYNDSQSMWLFENGAYGAEALYLLACNDINYAYLLSQYLIPYWDDRYTVNYECYLFDLVKQHGWIKPLIKAYLYCDNSSFRAGMMKIDFYTDESKNNRNPILADHLKNNLEDYEWFKNALKERLLDEPMLYYKGEDDRENPVISLYLTLGGDEINEDDEEAFSQYFINDTLENEATDLYEEIVESTDQPLMRLDGEEQKEAEAREYTDKDYYEAGEGIIYLKPFILALKEGRKLWSYIESGDHVDTLKNITEIDVMSIALKESPALYHKINYYLPGVDDEGNPLNLNKGLIIEMEDCLREIIDDLTLFNDESLLVEDIPQAFNPPIEHRGELRYQQLLRILDIFYLLLGKPTFSEELCERIVDEEEEFSITEEEFFDRYSEENSSNNGLSQRALNQIEEIVEEFSTEYNRDSIDRNLLKKLENVASNSREAYDVELLGEKEAGTLAMASYLLKMDAEKEIDDQYSDHLRSYIEEGPWEKIANEFIDKGYHEEAIPETVADTIKNYICSKEAPKISLEKMISLLQENLSLEEEQFNGKIVNKLSKHQLAYTVIRYSDTLPKIVAFSFWAQSLPKYKDPRAKRFWLLMIQLAPIWTIERILRTASSEFDYLRFDTPQEEDQFFKSLSDLGVSDALLYTYDVVKSQNNYSNGKVNELKRYLTWINAFNMIQKIDKKDFMFDFLNQKVEQLKEGLKYACDYNYVQFYRDLAASKPENKFECDPIFKEYLHNFFIINWKDDKLEGIERMVHAMMSYIDGIINYEEFAPLFWEKIKTDRFITKLDAYKSTSLEQFFWGFSKDRQDRLIKLFMNNRSSFSDLWVGLERGYKEQYVYQGKLKFNALLDLENKDNETALNTQAHKDFLKRVLEIGIDENLLIEHCISESEDAYSDYLATLGRRGQLNELIPTLSYSDKKQLLYHFEDQSNIEQLMSLFMNDSSRKIKDKAKKILQEKLPSHPQKENIKASKSISKGDIKYYSIQTPTQEGISISKGEEFIRGDQAVVVYEPIEFDGFGIAENDLSEVVISSYTLISEKLAKEIASFRPFACYFIPTLIKTSDQKTVKYYLLKPTLSFEIKDENEHKNAFIFYREENKGEVIIHQSLFKNVSEIIEEGYLKEVVLEENI